MQILKRSLAALLSSAILITQTTGITQINAGDVKYAVGTQTEDGGTIVDVYSNGKTEYPVIRYTAESTQSDKVNITMYKKNTFYTTNTFNSGGDITKEQYIVPDGDFQEWKQDNEEGSDVKGLLRIDDEGYYYYNSANTHAQYDSKTKEFTLYENLLYGSDINSGNFMPYNTYEEGAFINGYNWSSCNDGRKLYMPQDGVINYHFGMKMEVDFLQNKDGKMANGTDMIFEFNGDDAVFVYIDDVLILNAGNIGYAKTDISTINFATGAVYQNHRYLGIDKSTLKNRFERAGYTEQQLNSMFVKTEDGGYRFADLTSHKLKMFYCDDGAAISRLNMKFSIAPVKTQNNITVTKKVNGDINPNIDSDVAFQYKLIMDGKAADAGTNYDIIQNGVYTEQKGTIDKDGFFTLKNGQSAQFDAADVKKYEVEETGVIYGTKEKGDLIFEYPESSAVTGNGSTSVKIKKFEKDGIIGYTTGELSASTQGNILFTNYCSKSNPSTLKITKKISDSSTPDQEFTLQAVIGDTNDHYCGTYTIGDKDYTAKDGKIILKAGQTAIINGILVGTTYAVNESDVPEDYMAPSYCHCKGFIDDDGCEALVINNLPKKKFTLTYDANGGTGTVPSDSHQYSSGEIAKLDPTSGGCANRSNIFMGWSLKKDSDEVITDVKMTADTTVYAVWKENHTKGDWYVRSGNANLNKDSTTGVKDYVQYLLVSNDNAFELGVQDYSWKFNTDEFDIETMPEILPLTITEHALTEKIISQLAENEGALFLHTEYTKKLPGKAEIEYNVGWAQSLEKSRIYRISTDGQLEFIQDAIADIDGLIKFNITEGGDYLLVNTSYSRSEEKYNTGDINDDGIIDGIDALLVSAYILNSKEFTDAQLLALDCNGDKVINILDRIYILSRLIY